MPQVRLADGVDPAQMRWPDLGYADAYLASYATFAALRRDGVVPDGVRFQAEYPTPLASIGAYIVPEQQQALLGSYEQAMFADLARLLAAVPHDQVAGAVGCRRRSSASWKRPSRRAARGPSMLSSRAWPRCVDQVPAKVPVGLHLCYGDYGHQHFKQPQSLALQVQVVDAVTAAAGRAVEVLVSFTVPQYQRQESYFAPLTGLTADPGTELNFALVPYHPADQEPGTTADQVRLIDAALAASPGGPGARASAPTPSGGGGPRRHPGPAGSAPPDHRYQLGDHAGTMKSAPSRRSVCLGVVCW